MVSRGDIFWAELGSPANRRPVCVLTRNAAIQVLTAVTCAPITRTIRGIASEVEIGIEAGLPQSCVITCDNLVTIPKSRLDANKVGSLNQRQRIALDRALRYALDINF